MEQNGAIVFVLFDENYNFCFTIFLTMEHNGAIVFVLFDENYSFCLTIFHTMEQIGAIAFLFYLMENTAFVFPFLI